MTWKLDKNNPNKDFIYYIRYDEYGTEKEILAIYEQDYYEPIWGKKPNDWKVATDNFKGKETEKTFKTKEQAINYAKKYMKSH
jgi:hypothetical protein